MPDSVLAIDLGKTGCRACLWHPGGSLAAEGPGAPGLAAPDGVGQALAAIVPVAAPLLRRAGLDRVAAIGAGAAGALAAPAAARDLAARLCTALHADRAMVASDATTAHAGALAAAPGIVLALGTGAVAMAVAADGTLARADGCGPWLGDEGGGAWLGLEGLRAALRAQQGRGPATTLAAAAEDRFGPLAGLPALFEGGGSPPRLAATFAPDVLAAATTGDAVAMALRDRAVAALAATVAAVAHGRPDLAIIGGLAAPAAGLVPRLLAALDALDARVAPVAPRGTALDGARRLATDTLTVHEPALCRATAGPAPTDSLDLLATEGVRPGLDDLDLRTPGAIVGLVLAAERSAQDALARAGTALAAAADAIAARMAAGGRLFTLGAGTPGRLAVLDAAELAPTYSVAPGQVIALLAGGPGAMLQAAEGAEDDPAAAAADLDAHGLGALDAVVGIAASGRTPFVVGGLRHAAARGALTVAVVNNPGSPAAAAATHAVEILTGAEIVAGSTRMTAGTTQKIALNAISTAVMVSLGKTYGARMVDVRATNDKLRRRARRIVQEITGADPDAAASALAEAGGRVKPAIVALLAGVPMHEALRRLDTAGGRVRAAVHPATPPSIPLQSHEDRP